MAGSDAALRAGTIHFEHTCWYVSTARGPQLILAGTSLPLPPTITVAHCIPALLPSTARCPQISGMSSSYPSAARGPEGHRVSPGADELLRRPAAEEQTPHGQCVVFSQGLLLPTAPGPSQQTSTVFLTIAAAAVPSTARVSLEVGVILSEPHPSINIEIVRHCPERAYCHIENKNSI